MQYRYEGNIFSGEKRSNCWWCPPASVLVTPEIAIIPAASRIRAVRRNNRLRAPARARAASAAGRDVRVTVVNDAKGAAESTVRLQVPAGWTATPPQEAVKFTREDETQTVRFDVRPPAGTTPANITSRRSSAPAAHDFARGYQVIEYPHIRRAAHLPRCRCRVEGH